jgi:hypothetical protein
MATLTSLIQKNPIGIYIFLSESIEFGIPIGFFHMGMTLNLSEGAILDSPYYVFVALCSLHCGYSGITDKDSSLE